MKELTPEEQAEFDAMWKAAKERTAHMTDEEKLKSALDDDYHCLAGDPLDPEKYPHVKAEK